MDKKSIENYIVNEKLDNYYSNFLFLCKKQKIYDIINLLKIKNTYN
ncbi:MAG: hypothetical protein IJJ82_04705 [Clostridia bacterium]|nr:hypothetical protein [Clostridia bacterium]